MSKTPKPEAELKVLFKQALPLMNREAKIRMAGYFDGVLAAANRQQEAPSPAADTTPQTAPPAPSGA